MFCTTVCIYEGHWPYTWARWPLEGWESSLQLQPPGCSLHELCPNLTYMVENPGSLQSGTVALRNYMLHLWEKDDKPQQTILEDAFMLYQHFRKTPVLKNSTRAINDSLDSRDGAIQESYPYRLGSRTCHVQFLRVPLGASIINVTNLFSWVRLYL